MDEGRGCEYVASPACSNGNDITNVFHKVGRNAAKGGAMRRQGLTWIEVIVVLAAVGLLVALVMPVFVKSRQNNQKTACLSNLHAIGMAIKQYLGDNSDSFPLVNGNKRHFGWADAVRPYLKDAQLFQCPTDNTWPAASDGPKSRNYTDYFYNARLNGQNESRLQYIASTIMLGESIPGDARQASSGPLNSAGFHQFRDPTGAPIGAATRHLDGSNVVFADGHGKWIKCQDYITCYYFNGFSPGAVRPSFAIN